DSPPPRRYPRPTLRPEARDERSRAMAMRLGSGDLLFEPVEGWEKLPAGWSFIDVAGVAVDGKDNVYVFNRGEHPVVVFDRDGNVLRSFGEGQFIRPHNVVIDKDDLVYVADREAHRIQVFDANGRFVTMWNNIHRPDGICLDAEGNFFIGELNGMGGVDDAPGLGHRVSVYDLHGQLQTRIGLPEEGEGPTQFIAPHGVDVDSHGDLYVGDVAFTIRR